MIENREISERLEEALKARVAFADNLKPALELACQQLESMCPAVMGVNAKGFVGTLATPVPRGAWLIVLADRRKVFTIQMLTPPDGVTRGQIINDCVAEARAILGHAPSPTDVLHTIELAVDKHGGKPGKKTPTVAQQVAMRILGLLFGACPPDELAGLVEGVEKAIAADICPLHVGLVGTGSTAGTSSGVWPLGLPFAPYVDSLGLTT